MSNVLVIAEAGVNHNGRTDLALALVDAAWSAGADAVKFQAYRTSELVSPEARQARYQHRAAPSASQAEMLAALELSGECQTDIAAHCARRGIEFMASAFDRRSLDLTANHLGVTRLKIPSGELTHAELLLDYARTGLPLVLSTGMATMREVRTALGVLAFGFIGEGAPSLSAFDAAYESESGREAVSNRVTLLHCTSDYPAPFDSINLRAMVSMREEFALPVGLSDHSSGTAIAPAAVALGAIVIEKHLTLDRKSSGPDHQASLEPDEFAGMVRDIRQVEQAMGDGTKRPAGCEQNTVVAARRSLVALRSIEAEEQFSRDNCGARRPGDGVSPMLYWCLLGRRARRVYAKGELIDERELDD